ncbi:DUF262 domain-containing protein [Geomonas subterranea]|uniref:DUF262 domain-containing protein n=1 Tax=Geomonas subterranea TaxID=2847989 RepID=UPI001CD30039|nr:DUF262 domain-containing protein [Geomonas fuzhouensis]
MAKTTPIYSVKQVYTKFFEDEEKKYFIIPAYQRGYKWTSDGAFSHVQTLMRDLLSAYLRNNGNPYYLQFITLKPVDDGFEIIDGQQRITTLTIFFCVWFYMHPSDYDNFVLNKLRYEVRCNFIDKFIYSDVGKLLSSDDWQEFLEDNTSLNEDIDNQDVFYIFKAAKSICQFTNQMDPNYKDGFIDYVCSKVYIIINQLDNDLTSEKVFINVNKGVKLEDEDLVKGLIITRIPLDTKNPKHNMTEIEINEIRSNIGRQWDYLVQWTTRSDIAIFFNGDALEESKGLKWLIDLSYPDVQKETDDYPVFSYLDSLCRTKNIPAADIFNNIRQTMLKLNDLICDPEMNNLLGYILHSKQGIGIKEIWKEIRNCKTKCEILTILKNHVLRILPCEQDGKIDELNYNNFRTELFDLFIMLDLYKFLPISGRMAQAYDFPRLAVEKWSIEHIFPQSARDFKAITSLKKEDIDLIKELLPEATEFKEVNDEVAQIKIALLHKKIMEASDECKIELDERDILADMLTRNASDLHRLGNLALLQSGINSVLSNHYFDEKRKKLVGCVSEGKFVPYHTYDVFSKLIISSETGLHAWSIKDITNHEEYINTLLKEIVNYLKAGEAK